MNIFVKVNDTLYPASISGKMTDKDWDGRESKAITMHGDFETVNALFPDGTVWSIVVKKTVTDGDGNETIQQTEYDNSEYNIRGNLIVHNNGLCTVEMGKETELELAYTLLYGGIE